MEALLIKYGYVLFFLGVAAEGDAFLIGGAFLAYRGLFQLPLVIFLAITSNTLAGLVYYLVSRARGRAWLENRFSSFRSFARVISWMARHSERLLLGSRYAVGFRIIIPAACGALGMPPARFNILNLLASIIWVVPTALLGYYFGDVAEKMFAGARHYELSILVALLLAAGLILLYRHLHRSEWIEDLKLEDLHYLAPLLIGCMGAINVVSAVWPRSRGHLGAVGHWLSLSVTQPSRPLMLVAGVALIQVSRSLARRKTVAWFFAVLALAASLLLHVTRAFDLHNAIAAGLLLAYLIPNRRRFNEAAEPGSFRMAALTACMLAAAVFIYGYIGLWHLEGQFRWHAGSGLAFETFRSGILILEPGLDPKTAGAAHFLTSLQIAGWLARVYLLILILPPVLFRRHRLTRAGT
jgi:membrane protein DedA with SNARE-associated domain